MQAEEDTQHIGTPPACQALMNADRAALELFAVHASDEGLAAYRNVLVAEMALTEARLALHERKHALREANPEMAPEELLEAMSYQRALVDALTAALERAYDAEAALVGPLHAAYEAAQREAARHVSASVVSVMDEALEQLTQATGIPADVLGTMLGRIADDAFGDGSENPLIDEGVRFRAARPFGSPPDEGEDDFWRAFGPLE